MISSFIVLLLLSMLPLNRSFKFPKNSSSSFISRLFSSTSTYIEAERFALTVSASTAHDFTGDLLVVPFFKPTVADKKDDKAITAALIESIPKSIKPEIVSLITEIIEEGNFKGEALSKQITRVSSALGTKYIAIVGLGKEKAPEIGDMEVASAYKFGRAVGSMAKEIKSKLSAVSLPSSINNGGLTQFFIGFHDVVHNDRRFRKADEKYKPYSSSELVLLGCSEAVAKDAALNYKLTKTIVSGVEFARDLVMVHCPHINPSHSPSRLIVLLDSSHHFKLSYLRPRPTLRLPSP